MQIWWKNPRIIGSCAYWLMRLLTATLKIKVVKPESIQAQNTYLFAFWHGNQFLPSEMLIKIHRTPMCAMVSPSRDGAMLAEYLGKFGYWIVRGSSRDNGTRALIELKQKLEQGFSVGFGIDGPIGPIHVVKPGIAFLAQKCGIQIVPLGSAFSRCWTFTQAWDQFKLPKPFARAALVFGEPIEVGEEEDLKQVCLDLECQLKTLQLQAEELIKR